MSENTKSANAVPGLPVVIDTGRRQAPRNFWPKFWATLGQVPFSEELAAAWYCASDAKTPGRVKGVLFAALAYFVLPTDILPDFIVAIGFTDDATVLATAMGIVAAHIKPKHRQDARSLLRLPAPIKKPDEKQTS
ncbi:COGs COG3339 [hydrothermal vent metagenome]|uniref:COGs COG3339 n=1 Tax=hydrothermal vent metagenome TaxID=652676 RepID=A0A3B0RLW2_9ZZZZ